VEATVPIEHLTRRRAIVVLAATAAGLATGGGDPSRAAVDQEWRGLAMGTDARVLFCGGERKAVRAVVATVVSEIERLERALSLFRDDSEITRLNRSQFLGRPTGDMRRALALALTIAQATDGLFDPTVQALWEAHVDWFTAAAQSELPPADAIAAARARVDWRRIALAADSIRLGPGQRITLNGLGQGYVTDRIADLLHAHGFDHVLVDLGEQRALGPRRDGTAWSIGREGGRPFRLIDGALATSEGAGCVIGASGAAHHLFDPRTGRSAGTWRRMTVHHRSAAVADALSTALYAAAPEEIAPVLGRMGEAVAIWAVDRDGQERHWTFGAPIGAGI
jgi:thiamine biosynthesis lipoprotein